MASVLKGVVTNEGLEKSIIAAKNEGWYIYPTGFGISDVLGDISSTRNILNINPTWYQASISGRIVKDISTIEFTCNIPPGVTESVRTISEIYLYAIDENENNFLLAINGIEGNVVYDPGGSTILRIQITIQNLDLMDLYVFKYTQAKEIEEHNNDPNAHPDIRERIEECCDGGGSLTANAALLYWSNTW